MPGGGIKIGNTTTSANSHNSDFNLLSNPMSNNNNNSSNNNNTSMSGGGPRSGPVGSASRFNLLASNTPGGQRTNTMNSRVLGGSINPRDELMAHRYIMNDPGNGVLPMCKPNRDTSIYPDFTPWHKTKTEDEIAIDHLQKGYSEGPLVFNETTSARTSVYPMLKGKSNISALSYFMIQSMSIRDKKNRILSNSTFKPPPRVTLTDQKREAWLRDLATPSVSLRRLSRTIPHGLRNRVLLEQCCNKSIPVDRAVWLVRCVGANELRALRRKGHNSASSSASSSSASSSTALATATSESSWLHDWTEQVTDFIYKIANDCIIASNNPTNKPNNPSSSLSSNTSSSSTTTTTTSTSSCQTTWQAKMQYILRLSAYLFSENLLDIRLFLQWCLKFLEQSSLEQIPLSLLFIRLFWNGFHSSSYSLPQSSQSYSKQLAEILLCQYCKLSQPNFNNNQAIAPIKLRISQYAQQLFILSPDSFVIPTHWANLGGYFNEAIDLNNADPNIKELAKSIRFRNEALMVHDAPVIRASRNKTRSLIQTLNKLKATQTFDYAALSATLLETTRLDEATVFKTVFEWAVLYNSTGMVRIFICTGLTNFWNEQQLPVSEAFHSFIDDLNILIPEEDINTNNKTTNRKSKTLDYLYELIAQFLNIKVFSLSLYFRRLIASGVLFIPRLKHKARLHTLILSNLPIKGYFPEFANQRLMLLNSIPSFEQDQDLKLQQAKDLIRNKLPSLFNTNHHDPDTNIDIHMDIDINTSMAMEMDLDMGLHPESNLNTFGSKNNDNHKQLVEGFPVLKDEEIMLLSSLLKGTKITLSQWLLDTYAERLNKGDHPFSPTVSEFAIIQAIFENLQCLMAFYLCLKSTLTLPLTQNHDNNHINNGKSMRPFLLYYIAQTVRYYFQLFATFGDVSELIESIFEKYKLLYSLDHTGKLPTSKTTTTRPIPFGVRQLLRFVPEKISELKPKISQEIVHLLQQPFQPNPTISLSSFASSHLITILIDLLGSHPDPSRAGHGFVPSLSPMSEVNTSSMIDTNALRAENNNSTNNINSSDTIKEGISDIYAQIDQMPFTEIFGLVTDKFLASCKDSIETKSARDLAMALQQLRYFNEESFDDLMTKWLRDQVEPILYFDLASFSRVVLFLIIYECILMTKMADIFLQLKNIRMPGSTVSNHFILSLMSDNDSHTEFMVLKPWESSFLKYLRSVFSCVTSENHGNDGTKIYLRYILQEILDISDLSTQTQQTQTQLRQELPINNHVIEFLTQLSTSNFDLFLDSLIKPILDSNNYYSMSVFHQILLRILQVPSDSLLSSSLSPKVDIMKLIKSLNDFTLPLFQFDLKLLFLCYKIKFENQNQRHGHDDDGFHTLDIDTMIDQAPGQPVTAPTPVFLNSVSHPNEEDGHDRFEPKRMNSGRAVKSEPGTGTSSNKSTKRDNEIEANFANTIFECIWDLPLTDLPSPNFRRLFADLLVYLPLELKGEILVGSEIRFLLSTNFPRVLFDENPTLEPSTTTATKTMLKTTLESPSPTSSCNIVPLLLELVDAMADSCTFNICTARPFAITTALDRLIFIAENTVFEENTGSWNYREPDTMMNNGINTNGSISAKSDLYNGIHTGGLLTIDEANETNEGPDGTYIIKEEPGKNMDNEREEEGEEIKPSFSSITKDDIHDGLMLFAKIVMIHRSSFTVKTDQPMPLRDQIVNGLGILLELPFVDAFADLYGLLFDTLNAIRAEISDSGYNGNSTSSTTNNHNPIIRNGNNFNHQTDTGGGGGTLTGLASSPSYSRTRSLSSSSSSSARVQAKHSINEASNSTSTAGSFRCQDDHDSYLTDLMVFNKVSGTFSDLNVRSFDLLEESNPTISMNDVAINLALFGCTVDKRNPN